MGVLEKLDTLFQNRLPVQGQGYRCMLRRPFPFLIKQGEAQRRRRFLFFLSKHRNHHKNTNNNTANNKNSTP